jgi:alkylhydroperoxidase family enzyme
MAYIPLIPEDEADGSLKQLYDMAMQRAGYIANIIRLMSRDDRSCAASMQLYISLMKSPNALSPARRELIAAVVSNVNDCYY